MAVVVAVVAVAYTAGLHKPGVDTVERIVVVIAAAMLAAILATLAPVRGVVAIAAAFRLFVERCIWLAK